MVNHFYVYCYVYCVDADYNAHRSPLLLSVSYAMRAFRNMCAVGTREWFVCHDCVCPRCMAGLTRLEGDDSLAHVTNPVGGSDGYRRSSSRRPGHDPRREWCSSACGASGVCAPA
jgi:hypothetical protein